MQSRSIKHRAAVAAFVGSASLMSVAAQAQTPSRGELLYANHCIECHSAQVHWRDGRLATDWNGLKAQVRRWQGTASLAWGEEDIAEVARYLNERIYRFPQTSDPVTSSGPALVAASR
jgi:mono/diheme cytochrome c family protein